MERFMVFLQMMGYAVVAYFFASIVHEMGHVVCGLICNWKFLAMCVGPFKFYRNSPEDKIRFGIEKNPAVWGGYGGTFPRKLDDDNIRTFAKILLAGPVASLILGAVFIVIMIFTKSELAMMIGFVAIGEGVACILPMNIKTGILYNDGTRFKRIVKGGKEAMEEKAILSFIFKTFLYGEDDSYDNELIDVLLDSEDESIRYYGLFYHYQNAKLENDEEAMDSIRKEMETLGTMVSSYVRQSCAID